MARGEGVESHRGQPGLPVMQQRDAGISISDYFIFKLQVWNRSNCTRLSSNEPWACGCHLAGRATAWDRPGQPRREVDDALERTGGEGQPGVNVKEKLLPPSGQG